MIAVSNLKLRPGEPESLLKQKAAKALGIAPDRIESLAIRKKSLDARRKPELWYIYTVGLTVAVGVAVAFALVCEARLNRLDQFRIVFPFLSIRSR